MASMPVSNGHAPHSPPSRPPSVADADQRSVQLMYNTEVRHGLDIISKERMFQLAEGYYTYFADKRHETQGIPHSGDSMDGGDWRVTDRQRTVNAALVLCLNLGVDPPDIIKTQPAARLEAWVDPQQYVDSKKALEQIGKNLQAQYESLSMRTKYKQSLDPTIDDIKRFCVSLRRSARDDRILFHYNGHGVPRPTASGEVWVFNRGYTQYIPLSVYELQTWLGTPVIYCYDCSGAGNIIRSFNEFVKKRKQLQAEDKNGSGGSGESSNSAGAAGSTPVPNFGNTNPDAYDSCIQLGACRADEVLPMNPDLPADLFTCCITTPVDMAVKWFLIENSRGFVSSGQDPSTVQIPGKITDRRTPLGELNWIFTAITDTIAWSMLDPVLFKRLFRQDLIVAAMFRNFLLAKRIMRAHNCHPVSSPEIPDTCDHPLWESWDAAINHCLLQVTTPSPNSDGRLFSDFFEQQLTAFEMWLNYQSTDVTTAPEQLPIVLQVLLSQIHRLRALSLLCRYLDLGPEAVKIALSIGFFIYVLKLLQSPAPELRPVLVFIWARIMAVYRPVQTDLIKDHCYTYFVNILLESSVTESMDSLVSLGTPASPLSPGSRAASTDDAAMCCFILAQFAHDYPNAQQLLLSNDRLINVLEQNLEAESPLLRQWSILLLAELMPHRSVSYILWRLKDPIPEIRAGVLYSFSCYLQAGRLSESDAAIVGKAVVSVALDGSPIVRYELLAFLSQFVKLNENKFLVCAFTTLEEEFAASKYGGDMRSQSPAHGTVSLALWRCLLVLTDDAMPQVRIAAQALVDHIQMRLMQTPLDEEVSKMANVLLEPSELQRLGVGQDATGVTKIFNSKKLLSKNSSNSGLREDSNNEDDAGGLFGVSTHAAGNQGNQQGASPAKSLLISAVHWIVGNDTAASKTTPQAALVSSLKSRRSLASLITPHGSPPEQNHGIMRSHSASTDENLLRSENRVQPNGSNGTYGHVGAAGSPLRDETSQVSTRQSPVYQYHQQQQQKQQQQHVQRVHRSKYGDAIIPGTAVAGNHEMTLEGPHLILVSDFREFCVEYYREPQLKPREIEEAGSRLYYEKVWRKYRNEKIMVETQMQKGLSVTGSWGNQTNSLEGVGEPAKKMVFAQFEPHLVGIDSTDVVVFDWQRGGKLLNRFQGGRELSDVQLLNEDDSPLVLTASRDGMARVFRNYEDPQTCSIVTSWWLFADLMHHQPSSPFAVVDWQQSRGHLLVGGDTRVVRVWDASREQPISDIPLRTSAHLTALTSDKVAGDLFFAGFSDGAIHVYDRRLDKQQALIRRWKPESMPHNPNSQTRGHANRILNLRMQRGGPREVASGSSDGIVCLWDVRSSSPVGSFQAHTKEMRCMDLHEHAPVIATASRVAGVWSTAGRRVSTLKGPSASLLSTKVSPVGSVIFHPHQMVLAMSNAEEPAINVFRCTP